MKGSQKALLKLIDSNDFLKTINELIKETGAKITNEDVWKPKGMKNKSESRLNTFLRKFCNKSDLGKSILDWWVVHNSVTPNWDFLSTCSIDGVKGLLLIETKAHKGELPKGGKDVKDKHESRVNHKQVFKAIKLANDAINEQVEGVAISRDKYYQLSNRVAHAWWLADKGIPVVLLYLGFLNCKDMDNGKNKLFKTDQDWQTSFIEHAKQVGVDKLLGKKVDCGEAEFQMISKSI